MSMVEVGLDEAKSIEQERPHLVKLSLGSTKSKKKPH